MKQKANPLAATEKMFTKNGVIVLRLTFVETICRDRISRLKRISKFLYNLNKFMIEIFTRVGRRFYNFSTSGDRIVSFHSFRISPFCDTNSSWRLSQSTACSRLDAQFLIYEKFIQKTDRKGNKNKCTAIKTNFFGYKCNVGDLPTLESK